VDTPYLCGKFLQKGEKNMEIEMIALDELEVLEETVAPECVWVIEPLSISLRCSY
jgi:hypothetical protein